MTFNDYHRFLGLRNSLVCKMKQNIFMKMVVLVAILWAVTSAFGGDMQNETPSLRLTVVFNNVPFDKDLRTSWGFSCLIEGTEKTILFDTGGDGNILLDNMKRMNIDPLAVDMVFLSHIHADHTGGLEALLKQNPRVTVCLPECFPASIKQAIQSYGAEVKSVHSATRLLYRVHSTGEMGDYIKEQALILETSNGLVIITGCAHPGIVNVIRKAKELFEAEVCLVMGGFHLAGMSNAGIRGTICTLKDMGVKQVAPSHCTGEKAIASFQEAWGDNFLEGGVGAIIELPK